MSDYLVLVADDEVHIRVVVEQKLRAAGIAVMTASGGEEAYEMACAHQPQLVITDLQMPGGDGLELGMNLKTNPQTSDIPVLMMSARGFTVSEEQLAQTNIREILDKPFSPRNLIARVKELLGIPSTAASVAGDAQAA